MKGGMLKVTAWLASPLCGEPPQLDALCESRMHRYRGTSIPLTRGSKLPDDQVHIPMLRQRIGGFNVACCTGPIYQERGTWTERYAKRLGVENADLLAESQRLVIATGNATYKSYRLPNRIMDVERVVWLCKGDRMPLKTLLRKVTAIGKDTSQGYGRLDRSRGSCGWELETLNDMPDCYWYAPSEAGLVLMRPLPAGEWLPPNLIGSRRDYGACCGPYWHPERFAEIVSPC